MTEVSGVRNGSRSWLPETASRDVMLAIVGGQVVYKSEQSKSKVQTTQNPAKLLGLMRGGCVRTIYLEFTNGFGD